MGRITTEQADALHALLENVDVENAVVNILLPAQRVDLTLDVVRDRLCTWLTGIGHDPDNVTDVQRYRTPNSDRVVLLYLDRDDVELDTAHLVIPSFPWKTIT